MSPVRERQASLNIVVPAFNEAQVVPRLLERLDEVFTPSAYESIGLSDVCYSFVDDGSIDESVSLILEQGSNHADVRVIKLSRNFGHQAAVAAGLADSEADMTVVIDADLQDPPDLIPDMVALWRKGYEVVYAVRKRRRGNPIKRLGYWIFYRIYAALSSVNVPLDSGDFCLVGRKAVEAMNELPEHLRFSRALRSWVGFRQIALPYDRPERAAGKTKYSFAKLYELATDGLASVTVRPLRIAQFASLLYLGMSLLVCGGIILGYAGLPRLDPTLMLVLLVTLVSNGLVLFCLYVLGAYIGRTYLEVKGRPTFVVDEVLSRSRRQGDER